MTVMPVCRSSTSTAPAVTVDTGLLTSNQINPLFWDKRRTFL
jgi:hypothetical protein